MISFARAALLVAAPALAAAEQSVLRELRVNNNCELPVILAEAGNEVLAAGTTKTYTSGVDLSAHRISLLFESPYINENIVVLELNGLFKSGLNVPAQRMNVNFIAQWGFVDMPIEVAFWKDAARTELACSDGRARCVYDARDCDGFADGSARYQTRTTPGGQSYGYCRAGPGTDLSDPTACTSDYATYVNSKCELFDPTTGQWVPSARSVGYSGMGWTTSTFADGRTFQSTLTGREDDGRAITFECWEAPCITTMSECQARGQTSVGNSGFAITCDKVNDVIEVAVLEVTACPAASGGDSITTPAPHPAPVVSTTTTRVQEELAPSEGLIRSVFGKCLDAPERTRVGSKVHMWACSATNQNQQWRYDPSSAQIQNSFGICLASIDPSANGGAVQMQPCDAGSAQQRWVYTRSTGQIKHQQGICLDAHARDNNLGGVHMWACNTANMNQQWSMAGALPTQFPAGIVKLQNGICLDASNRNTNGGTVHMWECHPQNWNQLWVHDPSTGLIKNQYGACLDAPLRNTAGSKVHMWECHPNNANQQWRYDTQAGQIKSRQGICLQGPTGTLNGASLQMQTCNTVDAGQQWTLGANVALLHQAASFLHLTAPRRSSAQVDPEVSLTSMQRRRRRSAGTIMRMAHVQ